MATEIVMPRQGQSVEACTIVRWLKQPGERVGTGEVLCEIETDKAAFEVESTAAGTLLAQFATEGEEVPVLAPIAAVGEPGEAVSRRRRPRCGRGGRSRRYRLAAGRGSRPGYVRRRASTHSACPHGAGRRRRFRRPGGWRSGTRHG